MREPDKRECAACRLDRNHRNICPVGAYCTRATLLPPPWLTTILRTRRHQVIKHIRLYRLLRHTATPRGTIQAILHAPEQRATHSIPPQPARPLTPKEDLRPHLRSPGFPQSLLPRLSSA